jgi:hypothetical protein
MVVDLRRNTWYKPVPPLKHAQIASFQAEIAIPPGRKMKLEKG